MPTDEDRHRAILPGSGDTSRSARCEFRMDAEFGGARPGRLESLG
jgi:hypothetical protein